MNSDAFVITILVAPLVVAGIVAAVNSEATNGATERLEAWTRALQRRTAASGGWFLGYIVNPVLWMIVKLSDWTDGFTHRGIKNGTRAAAALYVIAAWLFLLYVALIVVVVVVIAVLAIYVAFKIFAAVAGSPASETEGESSPGYKAVRGSKSYKKTGIFSDEEVGRIAEDGTTFKKTGIFSEEETGRTDADGRVFRKTGMFSEEEVGRIDADGRVFKKTGMFSEDETGRIEKE